MNELEEETAIDIEKRVAKLLHELGVTEPPIDLQAVASFLHVDHGYYDLADPGLIREFAHKLKVGAHNVSSLFKKIDLRGLWLPDRNQILIDQALAEARQRWTTAHELCHRFLPTHRPFFFGDTAETLDPEYHEMLEQEANFCTQRLLFLGTRFEDDARCLPACLASVMELKKRYANSLASTLRRYVAAMHEHLIVGVISQAKWQQPDLSASQRCRYMFGSRAFSRRFSNISGSALVHAIDNYIMQRRGGPVGSQLVPIANISGFGLGFKSESFFNSHDILTLMVADV